MQTTTGPPAQAKWLWPSLALVALGLVGLVWSVSNVLEGTQRAIVGNSFSTELAGPGSYESELAPGTHVLVLFDLKQSDVTVTTDGAEVPLVFRSVDLTLSQTRGDTSMSTTIAGSQIADLPVSDGGTYIVTLGDNGTVYSNVFVDAPGATSTGGSLFGSFGVRDAISDNAVPLIASTIAILVGLAGTFIAVRAKNRHKKNLAYKERQARIAERNASRS